MGNLLSVHSPCSGHKVSSSKLRKAKLRLFPERCSSPLCAATAAHCSFWIERGVCGAEMRGGRRAALGLCVAGSSWEKHSMSRHCSTELSCAFLVVMFVPAQCGACGGGRVCFFPLFWFGFFGVFFFSFSSPVLEEVDKEGFKKMV